MKAIILSLFIISLSFAKPVLLNVQKEGCGWCARMDREVFQNKSAMKKLSKKFKVVILNRDFDDLPALINPRFFPTTYVLNESMTKIIDELPGYMSAHRLLDYFDLVEN